MGTYRRHFAVRRDGARQRRLQRRLHATLAAVAAVLVLVASVPVVAVVSADITINGEFSDWAAVFDDPTNTLGDPVGLQDPDVPDTANRDLNRVAYTSNSTNLFVYARRTSRGNAATYLAYIDRDADGLMEDTDMVLLFSDKPDAVLYRYDPAGASDPLNGDGLDMPGTVPTAITGASVAAMGDSEGIEVEGRVSWASLNLTPGSPVRLKFSCVQNTNLPGGINDNTGILTSVRRGLAITPDRSGGGVAGGVVTYRHSITNSGNSTETVDLTTASSNNWATAVRLVSGGGSITSVSLGPSSTVDVYLDVTVPDTASDGTKDIATVRATLAADSAVTAAVTDITWVGPVFIIPDREGSMAPSQTVVYTHTVTNNSPTTRTVELSAESSRGWNAETFAADGITPLPELTLAPHSTASVVVKVDVPGSAPIGTIDVTTLHAVDVAEPSARAHATATTTVRAALSVNPDREGSAAPNGYVWYRHTIRNNWPVARTVSLTATISGGWTVAVMDEARSASISSVSLGPNGDSIDVYVRVRVAATALEDQSSTVTLTASSGLDSDTARDITRCRKISTYSDSGFSVASSAFMLGDRVYMRAGGLPAGPVTIDWVNPSGTTMMSTAASVDQQSSVVGSYDVLSTAPPGAWTVVIRSGATVLAQRTFTVAYRVTFGSLSVTDVSAAVATGSVDATLTNASAVPMPPTTLRYVMWWDGDGDGALGTGDTWVDASGAGQPYSSGTTPTTHASVVATIGVGGTWSDADWQFSTEAFPYSGTWQVTAFWTTTAGIPIAEKTTSFQAKLSDFTLSVGVSDYDFGLVDPGQSYDSGPIAVSVYSGRPFDLTKSLSGQVIPMGLTTELNDQLDNVAGTTTFIDRFLITVPWTTTPGPVDASVTYTIILD